MVERYIPKAQRHTQDSFTNFQAQVGIGTNNIASGGTYGFNPITRNRGLLEWTYRGSWVCGACVDTIANDMTLEGITLVSTLKPDKIETIVAEFQRKQIWQSFNQVTKWGRLYGGALGLVVIKGQDPATPLRLETIAKDQFQGIITLDRWMVNPDLTQSITDPGPEFGCPAYYDVIATSFQFPFPRKRIHYSRLIRIEGVELPFWQKQTENMWGMSVLERVWDRLLAYDSTTQGAAQLAYKAYLRTIKIKDLRKIIATGGKAYTALTKQIETIRLFQANEGITLLDANDEFDTHQYTFTGLDSILEKLGDQISGAVETPQTRMFGLSPGGLNSDGESGMQVYEGTIKRLQERWYRRPLDVVLRVAAASCGIEIPEGTTYEFNSIRQLTELQKSEMNANDVAAFSQASQIPGMKQATLLKEMRQAGKRTGYWSNITDKDIKDAEEADMLPSPEELMMQAGAEGGPGGSQAGPGAEESKAGLPGGEKGVQRQQKAPYALSKGETEDGHPISMDVYRKGLRIHG